VIHWRSGRAGTSDGEPTELHVQLDLMWLFTPDDLKAVDPTRSTADPL